MRLEVIWQLLDKKNQKIAAPDLIFKLSSLFQLSIERQREVLLNNRETFEKESKMMLLDTKNASR